MREKKFSPNHIENDAEIMKAVAGEMYKAGYDVSLISEGDFVNSDENFADCAGIFSMGRKNETLDKLMTLEQSGVKVINSSVGVYNSFRETLTPLLVENHIPIPQSIVFGTDEFEPEFFSEMPGHKVWLKCENHSFHREDVSPMYSLAECETTIREFAKRGFKKCLLQENAVGSEIKFYGLSDGTLFHWYYANGLPHHTFDEETFAELMIKVGQMLSLDVFGGDAIIREDGTFLLIDFNDWPSFAPIREQAGKAISGLIDRKIKENK